MGRRPMPVRSRGDVLPAERERVVQILEKAGCVAAEDEAQELQAAAVRLSVDFEALLARRVRGEPLAWITGQAAFCGLDVRVAAGVYVPRWQTETMAEAAARALPDHGLAVDLCTGAGAVAAVLQARRPSATILATDVDPAAVACATANGVNAFLGDLYEPLPRETSGTFDVITAVVPYVPTEALHLLPRDVLTYEPRVAIDGGVGGLRVLEEVVRQSASWLRPGGSLFVEIGGDQSAAVGNLMRAVGLGDIVVIVDEEGDDRAVAGKRLHPG